jgi:hypothetical protein
MQLMSNVRPHKMPAAFSLDATDYKLLERAVTTRFQKTHGRLNAVFFVQMFAWMFITLAVSTYFKYSERVPASGYGVVLLFAVLGFLFANLRAPAGLWLYRRYALSSNEAFMAKQSVDLQNGSLILESFAGKSVVPRSAIIDHAEDDRNHYLFLSGVHAIVIPKASAALLGSDFSAFLKVHSGEA